MSLFDDKAKERAAALAQLSDERLADVYIETIADPKNLHFAGHFVTAMREADGVWERLGRELARRKVEV